MTDVISFKEAIDDSVDATKRHLMLGNGFSMACFPDIFSYNSLFERADFRSNERLHKVFKDTKTTDFEHVIRMLNDASLFSHRYFKESGDGVMNMKEDANQLKHILVQTLTDNHPSFPGKIEDERFNKCRKFLNYFLGRENKKGKVYTLNYDLLLYWAGMHNSNGSSFNFDFNDGFGKNPDAEDDYVVWKGEDSDPYQRIQYLHGALHLFDSGDEILKYTWINTGERLLDQTKSAIESEKFPIFVAEGKSKMKLRRIKHNAYLYRCYKSFSEQMKQPNDVLFIYGHSLDENDRHIIKKVEQGKVKKIYISLYGNPQSEDNARIVAEAEKIKCRRRSDTPLHVRFFDAASAEVWD